MHKTSPCTVLGCLWPRGRCLLVTWQALRRAPRVPYLAVAILIILISTAGIVRSLPYLSPIRATDLEQVDQAVTFHDRHGLPLGTLLSRDQDHTMVTPLEEVAPVFIQAILAAEDGRYYSHGPLDLKAIVRATHNSLKAKQVVSGASTITMQLARMINPTPRNIQGKVEEIWTAWRLAAGMNRDDILATYINRIPMGSNIYGVEAASQVYFGVSSHDLTLAQASVLAALPNNPTYLNPYHYWDVLKQRQQYVLKRMVAEGWVTAEESDRAFLTDLPLQPRQQGIIAAPHFLFWAAKHLNEDQTSDITTTLDRPLQQFVETQVKQVVRSLQPQSVQQGAAIVIDNHSGEVLAYVGSVDYFSHGLQGQNDGVQALRQPGSTLKPFLYELALEEKTIRPNTVLADVPTYYPIPGAKLYSPIDYDETFQGPVRVRLALANSLNIPAIRVLEQVGVPRFLQRLQSLGFSHLNESSDYYGLGLALGSGEVTLWELAQAYVTMAYQGQTIPLTTEMTTEITAPISASTINIAPRNTTPETSSAWSLITNMLSDRHARARSFGVESALSLPFDAAVKTGTSSNFRDTWTVGFTSDYTVATWIGNFDGEPMHNVSGVTGAAPLWNRIMLHLHESQNPRPFPPPIGLVKRPICALSGLKPSPACPSIVEEYFYPADLVTYEQQLDTLYQTVTASPIALSEGTRSENTRPNNNGSDRPRYQLDLPDDYDDWLAQQSGHAVPLTQIKIISPQDGDVFLLPADLLQSTDTSDLSQRLEFKIAGPAQESVEWQLNGNRLPASDSQNSTHTSYFWPLQPGQWTLEVKSRHGSDRVQFVVDINAPHPPAQGFSIGTDR